MKRLTGYIVGVGLVYCQTAVGESQFGKVRYQRTPGKTSEVRLRLTDNAVQIRNKDGAGLIKEIVYDDIESLTYSKSKHARVKSGIAMVALLGPFGAPMFLSKGKKHWLSIELKDGDPVILRLSKTNFSQVTAAFEAESGISVGASE